MEFEHKGARYQVTDPPRQIEPTELYWDGSNPRRNNDTFGCPTKQRYFPLKQITEPASVIIGLNTGVARNILLVLQEQGWGITADCFAEVLREQGVVV